MPDPSAFLQVHCDARAGALHLQCSFELRHRWTVLFGASGSGKSSLLRLIAGLWRPPNCGVTLHGQSLDQCPAHRRGICYIAQQPSLFPHLDVTGNVRFGVKSPKHAATVDQVMHYLGIVHLRKARIATLSGGEMQRVAIARALLSAPKLLLLDESFTGMHEDLRTELIGLLREQTFVPDLRILSVTHSVSEAFASAEDVLRIGDGRLVAQGPCAEVLAEPRKRLLAQLNGESYSGTKLS